MLSLKAIASTGAAFLALFSANLQADEEMTRPNILWITSEDHGPDMGCYGDTYADTPNVDKLAANALRYDFAWSTYPVCAPARTTIISGIYPMSTGSEHMRSRVPYPEGLKMYPQIMRESGYYCTNHYKRDYNLVAPGEVWDDTSGDAHWKNRPAGMPFFAIFNSTDSHESQIRNLSKPLVHDPATAPIPAYHPDTETVRLDWARYYDTVTSADADAGVLLDEIAEAGLMDETIIFYYADHGSGMPGNKRAAKNTGLRVPLIIYIPEKFKDLRPPDYEAGGSTDRLVGFIDLAPTLLSLAGVKPPAWMEGHAFLGKYQAPPQKYIFGGRGRMDARYDLVRTASDGRYVYVRNYMPHRPHGQHLNYQWETATTREWERLHMEGKLTPEQSGFWQIPKAPEELYDLHNDPYEVHNLANSTQHAEIKAELRAALQARTKEAYDLGFLPEGELFTRAPGVTPYDFRQDPETYPFTRVFETAELASMMEPDAIPALLKALKDDDSAVRYWAALGLVMREETGYKKGHKALFKALEDSSPYVRIAAAESLVKYSKTKKKAALDTLLKLAHPIENGTFVSTAAMNVIDNLGEEARPIKEQVNALIGLEADDVPEIYRGYPNRIMEWFQTKMANEDSNQS